jgi:uncharacterized protein YkwD
MLRTIIGAAALVMVISVFGQDAPTFRVEQYHQTVADDAVKLTADETKLISSVEETWRKLDAAVPVFDNNIALACRQMCRVLDCTDIEGIHAWEPRTIQFTLRAFGITDAFYFPLVARVTDAADAEALLTSLVKKELQTLGVNRFGLALDLDGRGMLAAVFTKRLVQLGPFPREVEPGSTHLLWGGMQKGTSQPQFILSTPDGAVFQQAPEETRGLLWNSVYFPEEPGEYVLELMVHQDGPQVASLFPVYVGQQAPIRPVFKLYPGIDESADAQGLEGQFGGLINRERRKRKMPECNLHPSLVTDARRYSRVMADNGRLSHALSRVDQVSVDYTENISLSTSVHAAHGNLMSSPSHRRNILDTSVQFCGVGVVAVSKGDKGRLLYVTQRFSRNKP